MPTPSFFESRALDLWPHRWVSGIATLAVVLVFAGLLFASAKLAVKVPLAPLNAVFLSVICWLWGFTLVGVWFHPSRGTLRIGSPWFLGAPRLAQVCLRRYAALCLVLWFLIPLPVIASELLR